MLRAMPESDALPLELTSAELKELLAAVGDRLGEFVESLESQPMRPARRSGDPVGSFDADAAWLAAPVPESPAAPREVLEFLFESVIPHAFNAAAPGYLAYVPGGGLPSSAVAELVGAIVNRYTGLWIAAPAAVELETQAIRWLAELLGMPDGTLGVLTSGGSMSTLLALVAARDKLVPHDLSRAVAYASDEVHHSLDKAARVAGVPAPNVRHVAVDDRFRLCPTALRDAIRCDRERGLAPFFVCASAGTVNTGAVDPLDDVATIAAEENLWFHVDGAYGAAFRLVPELAPRFHGMERADSLTVDPHKGLFLPYGTGVLLARELGDLERSFSAYASYLPAFQDDHQRLDFCELTPELTRDWRGLRLWLPLRLHGAAAFRDALAEKRELALAAWSTLNEEPDVQLTSEPDLSLFAFRQRFPGCPDRDEENRRNRVLLERINAPRRVMLTGTELGGEFFIRVCVLHLRTHRARVDEAITTIRAELAAMRTEHMES